MTFSLRKQFSKTFKERLWAAQFGAPPGTLAVRDPYGNLITFSSATVDHIIPIKFFNTYLATKQHPAPYFDRYLRAANCQDNLQFLDRKTNLVLGSQIEGKLTRHGKHPVELIRYLNYRYSLDLPPCVLVKKPS